MKFYEALKAYEEGKEVRMAFGRDGNLIPNPWISKKGEVDSNPQEYRIEINLKWSEVASMEGWEIRDSLYERQDG
jgi:hypothetical protein